MANMRDEKVIDRWYTLLKSASGQADYIYKKSRENFENLEITNLGWGFETMKPGLDQGLLGQNKQLLCVTNSILRGFKMYIVARDYGINLSVAWFLTLEPEIWDKKTTILKSESGRETFLDFDLFDQEELHAFVSSVHQCVLDAVRDLMKKLKQDSTTAGNKEQRISAGRITNTLGERKMADELNNPDTLIDDKPKTQALKIINQTVSAIEERANEQENWAKQFQLRHSRSSILTSRLLMSLLLAVFFAPNFGTAQTSRDLLEGQRLRVMYRYKVLNDHAIDCGESSTWRIYTGQFQALDGDTLRIRTESSNIELAIPTGCVVQLWVYEGKKGNPSTGAKIGLAAGLVIGGIIGSTKEFCFLECGDATGVGILIGAPAGTVVGAVIGGGAFRSDRWREVQYWTSKIGSSAK
ncbi:MAG: glycine zipper family protein [bacterium]